MEDGPKDFSKRGIKIPNEDRYFFTPTKQSYSRQVERIEMWKKMGGKQKRFRLVR